jgi:hypothetical protein
VRFVGELLAPWFRFRGVAGATAGEVNR